MIRPLALLSILMGMTLAACSPPQQQARISGGPLLPMPDIPVVQDPGNNTLMTALDDYIRTKGAPANTQYEFTRIDLNDDGRREGVAIMKTPHQYWCDKNGCTMLVLQAHDTNFTPLSEIRSVRGPLIVSEAHNKGWKDIIVRIPGGINWNTKDVALRFNGKTYPQRPAFEPELEVASNVIKGVRIFP